MVWAKLFSLSLSLTLILIHTHTYMIPGYVVVALARLPLRFVPHVLAQGIFYSNEMYYVCNGNVIIYFLRTVCYILITGLQSFSFSLDYLSCSVPLASHLICITVGSGPSADMHAYINYMCLFDSTK